MHIFYNNQAEKKTFGYLANYTIEIPIDDLNTKIRGYGYGIRNADI